MKNHIYKIAFTIIWTILALWFNTPTNNGREVGDIWMEDGALIAKTGEGSFNLAFFALMMIPIVGIWLWGLFKSDSKPKTQRRRSRMF